MDEYFGVAKEQGAPLPRLDVLVRTGDTPQSVRRRMVKHPPHILITTPESLYLILTSPVAREMFRTLRTLIVDEIHTLVGNKRGVHLAISLERVVELAHRVIDLRGDYPHDGKGYASTASTSARSVRRRATA